MVPIAERAPSSVPSSQARILNLQPLSRAGGHPEHRRGSCSASAVRCHPERVGRGREREGRGAQHALEDVSEASPALAGARDLP